MNVIYIVIINIIITINVFIFIRKRFLGNIINFILILKNIILIRFYKFFIIIIKIFIYNNFEYLIRSLLLQLNLKARSRVILKLNEIKRFIYIIKKRLKRKTKL